MPSGLWIAKRGGVVGVGARRLVAVCDLALKTVAQTSPPGAPTLDLDAFVLADVISAMHPGIE
jgi:hypothetical protein